jgi:hypothetical protein
MVLTVVLLSMETTYGWLAMHSHARAVRVSVGVWLRALTSHDSRLTQYKKANPIIACLRGTQQGCLLSCVHRAPKS